MRDYRNYRVIIEIGRAGLANMCVERCLDTPFGLTKKLEKAKVQKYVYGEPFSVHSWVF